MHNIGFLSNTANIFRSISISLQTCAMHSAQTKKDFWFSKRHIYEVNGTSTHLLKCNNKAFFYNDRKHSGSRRSFVANLQQQKWMGAITNTYSDHAVGVTALHYPKTPTTVESEE